MVFIVIITRIGPRVFSPIYIRKFQSEEEEEEVKKTPKMQKKDVWDLALSTKKREERKTILHNSTHKRAPFFLLYALPRPRKEGSRAGERERKRACVCFSRRE